MGYGAGVFPAAAIQHSRQYSEGGQLVYQEHQRLAQSHWQNKLVQL